MTRDSRLPVREVATPLANRASNVLFGASGGVDSKWTGDRIDALAGEVTRRRDSKGSEIRSRWGGDDPMRIGELLVRQGRSCGP